MKGSPVRVRASAWLLMPHRDHRPLPHPAPLRALCHVAICTRVRPGGELHRALEASCEASNTAAQADERRQNRREDVRLYACTTRVAAHGSHGRMFPVLGGCLGDTPLPD